MTDTPDAAGAPSKATTDADVRNAKRALARDMVLYTLFRLGLVAVIAAVFYGIGTLVTDEVPLIPVFLFALVVAMPLSMVVGKGLRNRVAQSAAVIDDRRRERRDDFRRRLQGVDE
ncbi:MULTISPECIES: DUF4229 domain-containing protein [Tsukamurella]|uniref:DUF4229 domain-containing protein n=1 Tax=Tsukamurella strandjordii TaxID=147577 RepID=A0AA90N828_9ACTN|nr:MULTISPECIES: DUF4229 domain-containing protein [Tsukamurella]MDP0396753.1 DUF4229 domain-containing protein [Tsukamurella strandjordii]GIZ96555.1 hypothetical protein TTY48_11670 [Tsukamurella sp. TY48]